ncbi:glycosyltransferase family 2 protein [Nigerium massiliense]|uniref:glycosyltransferase family 2 protein n=1 Tax=Nigerium massiliense TaxID=1522317 RepID=UPI0005905549|nr:glycosyltransferase family 2 protein [Nigerium massiliense]
MVPNAGDSLSRASGERLLGTFVVPCFREEATVGRTLRVLDELAQQKSQLDWEIIVIDDGSDDDTSGGTTRAAAEICTPVRLLRHRRNAGLGAGMRTGIQASLGDVVLAVDCDLSYGVDDIGRLIDAWLVSRPHIVIASPYMDGGATERVPHALEVRSRAANRFLNFAAYHDVKTLTGMVRAYDGPFIRSLSLKAEGADVMVEIIYKAQILRARIEEIPATLSWAGLETRVTRGSLTSTTSRLTTYRQLINGYLWRAYWVPLIPGLFFGLLALILTLGGHLGWHGLTVASAVLFVCLITMSLMSLQNKRYFEELYNLGFGLKRVAGVEPVRTPVVAEDVDQPRVVHPGRPEWTGAKQGSAQHVQAEVIDPAPTNGLSADERRDIDDAIGTAGRGPDEAPRG